MLPMLKLLKSVLKGLKDQTQDICYITLNSYNLKDFFYFAHHEVVMFFCFAKLIKSVTFYLYICISWSAWKRLLFIVVVSNNKLFNRVSHNVVTWNVYLHLFIIPILTHFFSSPWIPCLKTTGNLIRQIQRLLWFSHTLFTICIL